MDIYLGFDVLPIEPDASDLREEDQSERRMTLLKSPVGISMVGFSEVGPRLTRRVRWVCEGFAAVKIMRDFVDARKGRAIPFWLPSNERDFTIRTLLEGTNYFTIETIGYSVNMFPSPARRHIRTWEPPNQTEYFKIINAVDGGAGFETIYTNSFGFILGASPRAFMSFVRLCRLGSDRVRVEWVARNYAVAEFDAVEIPNEVPA